MKYAWLRIKTFFWNPRKGDIVILDPSPEKFRKEYVIDLVDEINQFCLNEGPHHSTANPLTKEMVLFVRRPK